jgi:TIR domain
MAPRVFISYRREDAAGHAGRVHDRLEREFGANLLFMDVDAIPLGVNFIKVLRERVAECDVLLALIGPNWLNVRDEEGNRRLDSPEDFLRIEIATALQRDIPVIPILLDGARMPKASQLPKDLEELSVRNGVDVRHGSFHNDMDRVIRGLQKAGLPEPEMVWALHKHPGVTLDTASLERGWSSGEAASSDLNSDSINLLKPEFAIKLGAGCFNIVAGCFVVIMIGLIALFVLDREGVLSTQDLARSLGSWLRSWLRNALNL